MEKLKKFNDFSVNELNEKLDKFTEEVYDALKPIKGFGTLGMDQQGENGF